MNTYNDFSYYSKRHFENSINIGWCSSKNVGPEYDCSEIVNRIIPFLNYPFNTVRGNVDVINWTYKEHKHMLGFSEIRVISSEGTIYAAPDSILQRITHNGYVPPEEFLNALTNGVSPLSNEYRLYIERYNMHNFWGATALQLEEKKKIENLIAIGDNNEILSFLKTNPKFKNVITSQGSILNYAIALNNEELALAFIDAEVPITNYNGLELISAIKNGLYSVSSRLIDLEIPIQNDELDMNPLFIAIAYNQNDIAVRLFLEKPELNVKYNSIYEKECDILKWCASCNNIEMFAFLKKRL